MRTLYWIIAIGTVVGISACGGGGSGGGNTIVVPATAQGRFIDTVVEGLAFSSGDQNGITDGNGTFTYEVGQNVTFSVGSLELGSAAGDDIVTPVDLTGSNSSMSGTQNLVRFLLMLDTDSDSGNGITISNQVQQIADNWSTVDFTSSNLDAELAQIITDVAAADNRTPILPAIQAAQEHLEDTLACLSSGIFVGTFSGQDNGSFLLWIQHERFDPFAFGDNTPRVGVTSALAFSTDENLLLGVAPQQGLEFDSSQQFLAGVVSSGAQFSGELEGYQRITGGAWANGLSNESGTFMGERIAGGSNAVYRLSGFFNLQGLSFSADGTGTLALDIQSDNSVSGVMVTVRGTQTALSGTLSGNMITVSGSGNSFTLEFDANGTDSSNDLMLGTTSGFIGTWNGAGGTGDVIGTSCQPG